MEEVIRRYKGIKDATVVAFDETSGGKYIAAYVVSDEKVDMHSLNDFIRETKPPYMVPAVTMQIDKIPLNQNQKVNKKELPKPERKAAEIIKPQNDVQQKLFDCISEVLGYTEFGITTDIYDAGLTSITAIRLNILISKAFDIVIKTSDIKTILRSRLWRALLKLQEKKQRERFRRFTRLPIRRKVSLLNVLQIWEQPFTTFRIC